MKTQTPAKQATNRAALETQVAAMEAQLAELAKPVYPKDKNPHKVFATATDKKDIGRCGFNCLGHQLKAIADAKLGRANDDTINQLHAVTKMEGMEKAAQGLGEGVGPDGGFLLAPTYAEGILEIVHQQENLLDRCDKYDMAGPMLKIRAFDETSRVTGARRGGVRGYWVDEGGTITASKPKFRSIELVPHKLAVVSYATEELLSDGGAALEQIVSRGAAEEINFLVGDSIIEGTGAGQPLGILNAACTVSVAAEPGQATKTVITDNVVKMWARLHSSARQNACWFINQDVEPQLLMLSLQIGIAGVATYLPPGGLSVAPYATLLGKPVIVLEFCQTVGTVGDIILADLKQFIAATRGSLQAQMSIHVAFLTDETAFRFTFRLAGQPWWSAALTPFHGSNTQSPFITLATR